ncbi:MAG: zinc ribbon domain-containing protein [Anaerolineales bacterium]|nr:zinc ribbon domain-containing protein [Anaerolineales bacterium]
MKCPRCGTDNAGENAYCGRCGGKLDSTVYCPACGGANQADFSFCMKCGKALAAAGGAGQPAAPAPAPTIIIQQEQKKRPAWGWILLVAGLLSTLLCLLLVKSGLVDLPGKTGMTADVPAPADHPDTKPYLKCEPFEKIFYIIGDPVFEADAPHLDEGLPVDGEVVITLPDKFYYFLDEDEQGEAIYFGREGVVVDAARVFVQSEDDPEAELENGECMVDLPTIRCTLPYVEGKIRYQYDIDLLKQIDACELMGQELVNDILVIDNPPLEPAEEVCYSDEPYSFDNAKINYWFTQVPTTDLHLSIINDVPFLHSGYTVWLAQPPAAPIISAECKVPAADPNRVDCTFPKFAGPSATWTVMMEHNSCVFYEKAVWVAMPLCPAGETHHAEWPYNNGCCTDGCWCEAPGYGWGCWETCAAHCAG